MSGQNIVLNKKFFSIGNISKSDEQILLDYFQSTHSIMEEDLNKKISLHLKKNQHKQRSFYNFKMDVASINSFLIDLKSIDFFKKFSTLNLFIHEKGLNSCIKYEYSELGIKKYNREITDFKKLFQSIKKSKNKSFGQSTLKGVNFEILGTFLAKNFSLSKHNAILVISRDDFLPQTEDDINIFNEYCIYLEYHLEILFKFLGVNEKKGLIKNVFKNLPINVQVIFPKKNNPLENHNDNNLDHSVLFKNNSAIIINKNPEMEFDHLDLFHKERIKLLGDLLNTLRHEISNPLFGLKLTTELLTTESLNSTQAEFINEILISLNRCTSIIEDFTNLYRSDKELKQVSVAQLINEVLTLTKSETRQIIRNTIIEEREKPITVITNPTWLVQILFNLIVNAAHALKEANIDKAVIEIKVRVENNMVSIFIKDNGPNIPEDKIEEIFKPFFTTKATGTGLGLSISRNLAKKIGGDLEYLQQSGGACFKLSVPHE